MIKFFSSFEIFKLRCSRVQPNIIYFESTEAGHSYCVFREDLCVIAALARFSRGTVDVETLSAAPYL
jgi:hypothetical protein